MDVRIWTRRLVALILEVMDVAEDGLEDEEDDDCYAEGGVKGGELGSKGQHRIRRSVCRVNTYVSCALVGDIHSKSEPDDRSQVGEQLHAGMDPDKAAE